MLFAGFKPILSSSCFAQCLGWLMLVAGFKHFLVFPNAWDGWLTNTLGEKTSILELAYGFYFSGYRLAIDHNPAAYTTCIRKACNHYSKVAHRNSRLIPSNIATGMKTNGKVHPSGFVPNAWADIPVSALTSLACAFSVGRCQSLKGWTFGFDD